MKHKYDISKKSDMNRFAKDLENDILASVKNQTQVAEYEISCTQCGEVFKAFSGSNVCPHCGACVNLKLNFNF